MKTLILTLVQTYFKIVQLLLPRHAEKLALKFFFSPNRTKRRHYDILDHALIEKIPFSSNYKVIDNGTYYTKYSWGVGRTIILVHGWAGKATHFSKFIEILVDKGFRVVTFDAPAHGRSDGKRTNLPEFAQIINEIAEQENDVAAILGHSLGGIASSLAIVNGLNVNQLFIIASPFNMEFIFEEFCKSIPLNAKSQQYLIDYIEELSGLDIDYFSFDKIIKKIDTPITAFYDHDDRQAKASDAIRLNESLKRFTLHVTEGLGHQKILFDEHVIQTVIDSIVEKESPVLN